MRFIDASNSLPEVLSFPSVCGQLDELQGGLGAVVGPPPHQPIFLSFWDRLPLVGEREKEQWAKNKEQLNLLLVFGL